MRILLLAALFAGIPYADPYKFSEDSPAVIEPEEHICPPVDDNIYIVKFEWKQVNYSLNPLTHIRNAMNSFTFEIPVSKEYYEQVAIGNSVQDSFRVGSFVVRGSAGSMSIKVVGKYVR